MLRGHMLVAKTRDLVESFPTVPVSSKTDPCASSYDIFKFCTLLTLLKSIPLSVFIVGAFALLDPLK